MDNKTESKDLYNLNCTNLNNHINLIHCLLLRNFYTPITQISLISGNNMLLFSNDNHSVVKSYHETIYAESFGKKEVFVASKETTAQLPEKVGFYASAALFAKSGEVLGCLSILDLHEREFSSEQSANFTAIAEIVSLILIQYLEMQKMQIVFTDFIHKTAHDLKNPFTSISLSAELLKRKADDPATVVNFAERIENANRKIFKSLDDLRLSFPIDGDGFKLAIQEIDLEDFLADIKSSFIKSDIKTEHSVAETIFADYRRLKEAVMIIGHYVFAAADCDSDLAIKAYPKDKTVILEIAATATNAALPLTEKRNSDLSIARTLLGLQKGTLNGVYDDDNNRFTFYISLPLFTP